jgi:dTMP kinase
MAANSRGHFISIEGIEGCGKSTQTSLLKGWLEKKGERVLLAREPGGTEISEKIREILLDPMNARMDHRTELLLYLASRSQIVQELLLPALDSGQIVLVDRYSDSTLAYQGYGRGLDTGEIRFINSFASRDLLPDLTFLLDLDPVEGLKRKGMGNEARKQGDRLEMEHLAFHLKVREGFLDIARDNPRRIVLVDADREIQEIHADIQRVISERLPL